jgi:hypothetical protein
MNEEFTQKLNQLERRALSRVRALKKAIAYPERMRTQEAKVMSQPAPQPQRVVPEPSSPQRLGPSPREAPEVPAKIGLFRRITRFFKRR